MDADLSVVTFTRLGGILAPVGTGCFSCAKDAADEAFRIRYHHELVALVRTRALKRSRVSLGDLVLYFGEAERHEVARALNAAASILAASLSASGNDDAPQIADRVA